MRTAVFVDLPNFYSHLLKSGIEEPRFLRNYFLHWLDLDLLANALTGGAFSGIWVFYSGERIGPSNERLTGKHLKQYIDRINSLKGVTARDVNVPGEQRQPLRVQCNKCGAEKPVCGECQAEITPEWISEKGVDTSLSAQMFDTMDSWDTAFLLSGDADFVPVIACLRRRGKIVIGAGFSARAAALARECYDYRYLRDVFLREDVAAYAVFREKGVADQWLAEEVRPRDGFVRSETVKFKVDVRMLPSQVDLGPFLGKTFECKVFLSAEGSFDPGGRERLIAEFRERSPRRVVSANPKYQFYDLEFGPLVTPGISRRWREFLDSVSDLRIYAGGKEQAEKPLDLPRQIVFEREYYFREGNGRYEPVGPSAGARSQA
jgi:hypothetical protein